MKINFKNVTQEDFDYAWECLEDCKQGSAKNSDLTIPIFHLAADTANSGGNLTLL